MNYQSLYRKYRPSSFDDAVGQQVAIRILTNSIKNQKISHAYLFSGPRGTGKTSFAKIFAKTINCSDSNTGIPCTKCANCIASSAKECVDIIEIDAASNNGVEEIRELKNVVSLVPTELKYKVYIIDEVHMLTQQAFNALLKTLEEPPSHAVFILATTEADKVISTIVSRCQTIEFKRLSVDDITSRLEYISKLEKFTISASALKEIAINSAGGLRDAIGLLEKVRAYTSDEITLEDVSIMLGTLSQEKIQELINLIFDNKLMELITKIEEYYNSGIDLVRLTNNIATEMRNMIINSDVSRETLSTTAICKYIEKIIECADKMRFTENPKILLEVTLLGINKEKKEATHTEEQKKVEKIEANEKKNKKEEIVTEAMELESTKKEISTTNEELKNIRIGNTLSRVDKNIIKNIRDKWKNLKNEAFNPQYGSLARLLADEATPVAASNEYLIITFKTHALAEKINSSLQKTEEAIVSVINQKIYTIGLTETEWNECIKRYKEDKSQYSYKDEEKEVTTETELKEHAKQLFGEI